MNHKLSEKVSVSFAYDSTKGEVNPKWIAWKNRLYSVSKVGLHHKFREGRTLYHVFSVVSGSTYFRLILDTENLHWKLQEISDGLQH